MLGPKLRMREFVDLGVLHIYSSGSLNIRLDKQNKENKKYFSSFLESTTIALTVAVYLYLHI